MEENKILIMEMRKKAIDEVLISYFLELFNNINSDNIDFKLKLIFDFSWENGLTDSRLFTTTLFKKLGDIINEI